MRALILSVLAIAVLLPSDVDARRGGHGQGRPGHGQGRPGQGRPGHGQGRPGHGQGRPGHGQGKPGSGHGGPANGLGIFGQCSGPSFCTCADDSQVPMEVFTSTAADGEKKTVCVDKQVCYPICTDDSCTDFTLQCLDAATAADKPGNCPTFAYPYRKGPTEDGCTDDSSCPNQMKCCTLSPHTFKQCASPVGTEDKCGTCPDNLDSCTVNTSRFESVCENDAQCPRNMKCCDCGTTKKCRKPTSTSELA